MKLDLLFLDTETTGLDPERHEIWEVAYAPATHDESAGTLCIDHITQFFVPVSLIGADPVALDIGKFWERYPEWIAARRRPAGFWLEELAVRAAGRKVVGAVPNFDTERLERLLRRAGMTANWHYHLIDIEALVLGYLAGANRDRRLRDEVVAWKSDELSRQIGVDPEDFARHTAEGDVLWAIAQYAVVFELTIVGLP